MKHFFSRIFLALLLPFFSLFAHAQQASTSGPAPAVSAPAHLAPGFSALPRGAKLTMMPVDVELFLLTMGGVPEPRADWTLAARNHLTHHLRESAKSFDVRISEADEADADEWSEINTLHAAVASAIASHHTGMSTLRLPTKEGKLDWSLAEAVAPIREKTQADYALFVWVRDSYASDERKAAMVMMAMLGVGLIGGIQQGYASLVDLNTGQVVWFSRLISATGDLREREAAGKSVSSLLSGFPVPR